ncbi:hypothetical protein [Limnoglobus roseus]|uniref:Uncharacterized protein n=1 Tax=Limnoglobus roseus TaxID=2598579 RepID=A0A5C1AN41_9BACT|nr:hypothetical protein [Limnoglobus roseus]QEL18624.1 hypothetical protein PX52LOC_05657 [Limnoglobus roseus]
MPIRFSSRVIPGVFIAGTAYLLTSTMVEYRRYADQLDHSSRQLTDLELRAEVVQYEQAAMGVLHPRPPVLPAVAVHAGAASPETAPPAKEL